MVRKFSDFDVCKAFKHKDKAKILQYIECLYDKNSPLNEIQSMGERMLAACKKAGLNPEDSYVKDILDRKNEEVKTLVYHFQSYYQNSNKHQQLINDQMMFLDIQKILMTPLTIADDEDATAKYKKRFELSEISDSLGIRINRLLSEIYYTEEEKDTANAQIRQLLTPEQRIKMKAAS